MANNFFTSLLGANQPPSMMQSLLGGYYDPKQAKMKALLGAIGGIGQGLSSAQAGPYLTDAGVINAASKGMTQGYQTAQDEYMQQAMGAYDLAQMQEQQKRKDQEYQDEQAQRAAEQQRLADFNAQIDADSSLSDTQKGFLKSIGPDKAAPILGRQYFPEPQKYDQPNVFGTVYFDANNNPYVLDNQGNMRRPSGLPDDAQLQDPYQMNFNKARGTETGKMTAENQAAAPGQLDDISVARDLIQQIRQDPYKGRGTGFSSVGNMVPGTGGYDFQNIVNQAKSGAFLTAIQKMRGLGALSEKEGQAAMSAITRLDTATSEEAFNRALDDYEAVLNTAEQRVRQRAGIQQPSGDTGATKTYTFNPDTGELE